MKGPITITPPNADIWKRSCYHYCCAMSLSHGALKQM